MQDEMLNVQKRCVFVSVDTRALHMYTTLRVFPVTRPSPGRPQSSV